MARVRFLSTAKADLIEIRLYSNSEFGSEVADGYFEGFKKAWALLRDHPNAGPKKPELGPDIRCLIHRSHRILYSVEDGVVIVRRVVHTQRNAAKLLSL